MSAKSVMMIDDAVVEELLREAPDEEKASAPPVPFPSVTLGRVMGFAPGAGPLIDFPGNTSGELVCARTAVRVGEAAIGHEAVLAFEDGDPCRPIVLGVLQEDTGADSHRSARSQEEPVEVSVDGDTLVLSAREQIVLRCGRSSITLTNAGKVLIRGDYLLSRSSGANRIKGGSVQIN